MRVSYDEEADAAYIYLREIRPGEAEYTHVVEFEGQKDMVNLDFDRDGRLIGVEVLSASRQLPPQVLTIADPS